MNKFFKSKKIIFLIVSTLIVLCVCSLSGSESLQRGYQEQLKEVFINAESLCFSVAEYESPTGNIGLTDEQINDFTNEYEKKCEEYYTKDSPRLEVMMQVRGEILNAKEKTVDFQVDSGVENVEVKNIEIKDNMIAAEISSIGWIRYVKQQRDKFVVNNPGGPSTLKVEFMVEDGKLKVYDYEALGGNASDGHQIMNSFTEDTFEKAVIEAKKINQEREQQGLETSGKKIREMYN
jgi:hypothetical protein